MNTELMKSPAESADGGGDGGSFRLEALGGVGLDSLPDAPSKPAIPPQVLLLAVLVIAGGGALLVMRQLGMGPLADVAAAPIDWDLNKPPVAGAQHIQVI